MQPPQSQAQYLETGHQDMIVRMGGNYSHDVQFDYYGKRVATCAGDLVIKVFDVADNGQHTLSAELRGHEGAVFQLAWAHPRFGVILASCGYDKKVLLWKETNPGQWTIIYQYLGHEAAVNSISFAPYELGLSLCCGSADGSISVLTWKNTQDNDWFEDRAGSLAKAHAIAVSAVSWGPAYAFVNGTPALTRRFASCGCDNTVKIWTQNQQGGWDVESLGGVGGGGLPQHSDWVRDVAWAPASVGGVETVASCSADKTVIIWTLDGNNRSGIVLPPFEQPVWRVSWSLTGGILAVSSGDSNVSLWKRNLDNSWRCVENVQE